MLSRTKKNYTWFWCSGLHSADQLKPVHTGDYSPDFGDNLSPKTATVTEKKSATVAEFGRFLRQCGQGFNELNMHVVALLFAYSGSLEVDRGRRIFSFLLHVWYNAES